MPNEDRQLVTRSIYNGKTSAVAPGTSKKSFAFSQGDFDVFFGLHSVKSCETLAHHSFRLCTYIGEKPSLHSFLRFRQVISNVHVCRFLLVMQSFWLLATAYTQSCLRIKRQLPGVRQKHTQQSEKSKHAKSSIYKTCYMWIPVSMFFCLVTSLPRMFYDVCRTLATFPP
jgi:hypothetical protein